MKIEVLIKLFTNIVTRQQPDLPMLVLKKGGPMAVIAHNAVLRELLKFWAAGVMVAINQVNGVEGGVGLSILLYMPVCTQALPAAHLKDQPPRFHQLWQVG